RGLRWLRRAEVIVYDQLSTPALLDEAPEDALRIFAGKSAGRHYLEQSAINAILIHHARRGRLVVRLKGCDPFVFGRGGEEVLAAGRSEDTPAAVIHRGTTQAEETVVGTLGDIAARAAEIQAPAVIVIGEAVAFRPLLARSLLAAAVLDHR